MSDELPPPSKTGRRVGIAVAVALLAHVGLYFIARSRHGSDAPPTADPEARAPIIVTTAPEPEPTVAINLRETRAGPAGRLALATDLHSAQEEFQPSETPVFDKPPPLPRERLAYSAALGDGDSGRPGFHFDDLLPVLREIAAVAVGRRPSPPPPPRRVPRKPVVIVEKPDEAPEEAPENPPTADALREAQARAAAEAASQYVPMQRVPPRDVVPPPAAPELAAANNAEVAQFFGALTSQLVGANQRSLAEAVRAGPRETINIRFVVDPEGRVGDAQPVTPSDSAELDERAIRVVLSASPLPKPPEGLPQSRLQLTFPVQVYR